MATRWLTRSRTRVAARIAKAAPSDDPTSVAGSPANSASAATICSVNNSAE
jgi:hypothetical protein